MNWTTIYLTGKPGYNEEVWKLLEKSDLAYLPGSTEDDRGISLYWIKEDTDLRELKEAIGAKVVFKYRLRFYASLEQAMEGNGKRNDVLSLREKAMIREMADWEKRQEYLHTA